MVPIMFLNNKCKKCLLILLIYSVASDANAYIDPGTGSLLIQGLLAAIAGAMVTIKIYWHHILTFFGFRKDKDVKDQDDNSGKEE